MQQRLRFLIIAFATAFLTVAVLSSGVFRRFDKMVRGYDALHRSQDALERLESLEGAVKDVDRFETGLLLTHDSAYYAPRLQQAVRTILPASKALRGSLSGNKDEEQALIWARSAMAERLYYLDKNIEASKTDSSYTIRNPAFITGRRRSEEAIAHLNRLQSLATSVRNRNAMDRALQQRGTSSSVTTLMVVFGILMVLLFAGIIMELMRRVEAQRQSELRLRELEQSHSELEQITHAASHDLQEPLRKMQVLTDKIRNSPAPADSQTADALHRIVSAASHLQSLVGDLVHFTSLSSVQATEMQKVALLDAADQAMAKLQTSIKTIGATITCEPLPEVQGYRDQLANLFEALLGNSLKFHTPERPLEVTIKAETVSGSELRSIHQAAASLTFYRITIRDNGSGFDNQYAEKIFRLFQRVHDDKIPGKGVGLAMAQRIMTNHQGYITAHGHPQAGATFKLYFPVSNAWGGRA